MKIHNGLAFNLDFLFVWRHVSFHSREALKQPLKTRHIGGQATRATEKAVCQEFP